MRRLTLIAALALGLVLASSAQAAAEWRSQQPVAAGIEAPVPLGQVGDVEFWAPNRGVLITAGNGGVAAGLFAYDGTGWYRYSTVCGGFEGRIAWAGPDEFWTISDQPLGQETGKAPPQHISLCHFKDGQVVASYAEPVGLAKSYLPMNAAACAGPDDCWFAGDRLPGTTNVGAFHLHWDGTTLTAVPSLVTFQPGIVDPGRSVESLAFHEGSLYESVAVREGDVAPAETAEQPSLLHRILKGAASPFEPLYTTEALEYGGTDPMQLEAFRLTGDEEGLWALAGAVSEPATVTALRLGAEGFQQVPLEDPGGVLDPGDSLGGAAVEPGAGVWVGFREPGDKVTPPARLARIAADGTVEQPIVLPGGEEETKIGHKGAAGPIACPAAGQCWMATAEGWLFHLGPDLAKDEDPAMHTLIAYRPPDNSLPSVPPIGLPVDTSGENQPPEEEEPGLSFPRPRRPLVTGVRQQVDGTLLELRFVLHAKAHVQLIARRRGHVVAKTPRYKMGKGPHKVRLRLDPKRWPSKLDFEVHPIKRRSGR